MNLYLTGNIVFDGDIHVTEESQLIAIFENMDNETIHTEQIDCNPKTLAVFKYMPFEIKADLDLDGLAFRVEVRNGPVFYHSKPRKINTGVEQFDIQMRRGRTCGTTG